jgi:three-Cys-motif partner protein
MARQKAFFNSGTEKKLDAVSAFLSKFLDVMSNQHYLETVYVDAFAGTGTIPAPKKEGTLDGIIDAEEFAIGSALRALALPRSFSRYIFIDQSGSKLADLSARVGESKLRHSRVAFIPGDATEQLMKLCPMLAKRSIRAVVFLDPFGNQVSWELLEALAATQHVDLLYLFPAMLGVYRQISGIEAKVTPEAEASLDRLFGPHDWRSAFIGEENQSDLFGYRTVKYKVADADDITRFQIRCMRTAFKGCVLDEWLPLGRNGSHWYSLLFAMANPNPRAVKIGSAIARHIMTKS